ncbi:DEHA2B10406p [Debaryomyces hansenii CBS767]|uniref:DEHA2B10406p n=1 Tax=Debaryomyces hansenii (strain ATCC 36239 / CBS 767 / BCRC 21394 / JCM 1990 / NBRC 0083 / IGC 2968) TaxID=284592 RepID=Q6BWL4_DEBHA|nr:DEHA2B10406p [Debaryomyces hansenii CBS767]CAG85409.2 DEHA2B10406p [Debaryomyces hansenii CBS767]|eukprot:XP_457405.2 DEHA2B10406p [Debaryomyces hansenii CBS767]
MEIAIFWFRPSKKYTMTYKKVAIITQLISVALCVALGVYEETFMDSVYGELVASKESKNYKHELLETGELTRDAKFDKITEKSSIDLSQFDPNDIGSFQQVLDMYHSSQKSNMHQQHNDVYYEKSHESYQKYRPMVKFPNDDDTSDIYDDARNLFGGITTYGHFRHFNCFDPKLFDEKIDIAVVGAPFDTGVSFRPGARFGPDSIRSASKRLGGVSPDRGRGNPNTNMTEINPYDPRSHNLSIIDCGDVPMTPFDNRIALNQLYRGQRSIHKHTSGNKPKIITMGGDHTVTLMALKSAYEHYGALSVLHFDSHIDTWDPKKLGGGITNYMSLNHGTFLHYAAEQGYLNKGSCFHLGMRAPYIDYHYDLHHDKDHCGFNTITARDLDNLGRAHIVESIKQAVGSNPVYISVDIDVLDPASAPGTGTVEVGGWTARELLSILDGLEGINVVGGDVVEVSPPYDTNSGITALAATGVIDSIMGLIMVKTLSAHP